MLRYAISQEQETKPKPNDETNDTEVPGFQELSMVQMATVVYAVLGSIGALISIYIHQNFLSSFTLPSATPELLKLAAIAGLAAGVLLVGSHLFEEWFASFQDLKDSLLPLLGKGGVWSAFYLALISAFGEELLFRAAIQPFTGLFFASVLFGLLHLSPEGGISSWSIWAFAAGLLFGWSFESTGCLWPAVIAHFVVNFYSITRLQREFRTQVKDAT